MILIIYYRVWPQDFSNRAYTIGVFLAKPISIILSIRILAWYLFYLLGVSFWILPNLFYLKPTPIVSYTNNKSRIAVRAAYFGITLFLAY